MTILSLAGIAESAPIRLGIMECIYSSMYCFAIE